MNASSMVTLLYHSVLDGTDSGENYDVDAKTFGRHLRLVADLGMDALSAYDLGDSAVPGIERARKVMLTFDDGKLDNYETVFPMLLRSGMKGTFFVNPARVGSEGFVDWSQLSEMARHGMSVQSHGMTHRYLHLLPPDELDAELRISREEIRQRTGRDADYLSLPGGFFSRRVVEAAFFQGYRGVFTSDPGVDSFGGAVRDAVFHRYNIARDTPDDEVAHLLERRIGARIRRAALSSIKACARKALGTDAYHRLWAKLARNAR